MIPKKIHYCWFGGKELPSDVVKCIESWKKMAPEYEIIRWDESNFDVNSHPFMKKAYEEKFWAFVSDYARLKVVYENGGIYLDTDVELIKSLDELLDNKCYLGVQEQDHCVASGLGFGAEKGSSVLKAMLEEYDKIEFSKEIVNDIACPLINTRVIERLGYVANGQYAALGEVTIYPAEYFDPYSTGNSQCRLTDKTISIHHYSASWTPWTQRAKRRVVRMLGQNVVMKIKKILGRI